MTEACEKVRFSLICREIASQELCGEGIGTYSEKRLHKTLKRFFCDDPLCHEVRIKNDGSVGGIGESGKGGYIADIFKDGKIIEIQTGSFYSLKNKIAFYLEKTDFDITVVYPVAAVKYMSWIDTESGDVTSRRRSPKKGSASDILPELYWLSDMLSNDRLSFCIVLMEIEEYRMLDGWSHDKKRGSNRFERIPVELVDTVCLNGKEISTLMPQSLPDEFTRNEFSSALRLKGRRLYNAIKVLEAMDAIEKGEKRARSYVYRKK